MLQQHDDKITHIFSYKVNVVSSLHKGFFVGRSTHTNTATKKSAMIYSCKLVHGRTYNKTRSLIPILLVRVTVTLNIQAQFFLYHTLD